MKYLLTLFFFGLLTISCEEDNLNFTETSAVVRSATTPDTTSLNGDFAIFITVLGSSGCAQYARFEALESNDTTYFSMYTKFPDTDQICSTAIIEIDTSIFYSYTTPGMKYLVFDGELDFSGSGPERILDSVYVE